MGVVAKTLSILLSFTVFLTLLSKQARRNLADQNGPLGLKNNEIESFIINC